MFQILQDYKVLKRFQQLPDSAKEVVFYAETKADWVYFESIIKELTEVHGRTITYVTSDPQDSVLNTTSSKIIPLCIGSGTVCTIFFQTLVAKVFVMTLTDLGTFNLKRSKAYPVHYLYVFHSMVSSHMVFREKAYFNYDTVLCVGPHHMKEIRRAEELYELAPKKLVAHGYGRLDKIIKESKSLEMTKNKKLKVLIAPSWGKSSISDLCIVDVVTSLLASDFQVIYRPHPMTVKHNSSLIKHVQSMKSDDFQLELDIRGSQSLQESDIMISDWSGAALEYAFGLEHPVLFINTPPKVNNPRFYRYEIDPLEVFIRNEIGEVVDMDQLEQLPVLANQLCHKKQHYIEKIRKSRERWVYNLGHSGEVGAQAILEALSTVSPQNERPREL